MHNAYINIYLFKRSIKDFNSSPFFFPSTLAQHAAFAAVSATMDRIIHSLQMCCQEITHFSQTTTTSLKGSFTHRVSAVLPLTPISLGGQNTFQSK